MSEPLCQCGHGPRQHAALRWECYDCINLDLTNPCSDFTPRPDPTSPSPPARSRDDAERAITAVLAEHEIVTPSVDWVMCMGCDWEQWKGDENPVELHRAHVASVLADLMPHDADQPTPLPWYPPADGYEP